MARSRSESELPACYAMVHPGLEAIAGEEITRDLGGTVKRTASSLVVFRMEEIDQRLLTLRTVEDVFLYAWGTDQLSYRAEDLDKIRRWTAHEANWADLLRLHHALRPKPRGRPTFRLVTQMQGTHGYKRMDAGKALAQGLAGKLPESWRHAEENATVEIWLTIQGNTAVCGLRLSDRTMRHRTYKLEHRPASLRPTLAAAMVRLAGAGPQQVVVDPMCGAGTLLAEQLWAFGRQRAATAVWGGDLEHGAVWAASMNLRKLGSAHLARWDATRLPLADASVDRVLSNPPFGKQLGDPDTIDRLYRRMIQQYDRILRPRGRAVLIGPGPEPLRPAVEAVGWKSLHQVKVRILGQPALIGVWRKEA